MLSIDHSGKSGRLWKIFRDKERSCCDRQSTAGQTYTLLFPNEKAGNDNRLKQAGLIPSKNRFEFSNPGIENC
jgi:hypothetical protein